jgi:hypothetical protein
MTGRRSSPLIKAAVPFVERIDDGRFVNGPYDHDPYWDMVRRTYPHLWGEEDYQVARGGCSSTRL